MEENKNPTQENEQVEEQLVKTKKKRKKMDPAKKERVFFGVAVLAILVISIATANINMVDELHKFVVSVWNKGQQVLTASDSVKTVSKGAHVEIKNTQVDRVLEIYDILGEEEDEEKAVTYLQEVKTLYYHGKNIGLAAGNKEIKECIKDFKQELKAADSSKYRSLMSRYGGEDEYWKIVKGDVTEYVVAEKMKKDKREELEKKKDVDVEQALQAYIDEIVGYENFQ